MHLASDLAELGACQSVFWQCHFFSGFTYISTVSGCQYLNEGFSDSHYIVLCKCCASAVQVGGFSFATQITRKVKSIGITNNKLDKKVYQFQFASESC